MLVLNGSKPDVEKLGIVKCRDVTDTEVNWTNSGLVTDWTNVQEETHKGKNGSDLSCGCCCPESGPCRALKVRDTEGIMRKCAPLEYNLHLKYTQKEK